MAINIRAGGTSTQTSTSDPAIPTNYGDPALVSQANLAGELPPYLSLAQAPTTPTDVNGTTYYFPAGLPAAATINGASPSAPDATPVTTPTYSSTVATTPPTQITSVPATSDSGGGGSSGGAVSPYGQLGSSGGFLGNTPADLASAPPAGATGASSSSRLKWLAAVGLVSVGGYLYWRSKHKGKSKSKKKEGAT